jgi:uncharacterized protein (UPF0264 family)
MTQLLISVTSVAEAKIALENGADIIDLKDPSSGALGALPLSQIQAVVDYVHSEKPEKVLTSATIGDLPMQADVILQHVTQLASTKVDIIKIGFFSSDDYQPCLDTLSNLTQKGLKLIAVLFAEMTYPTGLIEAIKQAGFVGVMLDTWQKNGLTLLDYYSEDQRRYFSKQVLALEMSLGVAGSLRLQHINLVMEMRPSYMGFRGGVCVENERASGLVASKIRAIRATL